MPALSRLTDLTSHIQSQSTLLPQTRSFTMSNNMQSAHNNDDFKLENLFNVKDKVVVITG